MKTGGWLKPIGLLRIGIGEMALGLAIAAVYPMWKALWLFGCLLVGLAFGLKVFGYGERED